MRARMASERYLIRFFVLKAFRSREELIKITTNKERGFYIMIEVAALSAIVLRRGYRGSHQSLYVLITLLSEEIFQSLLAHLGKPLEGLRRIQRTP